MAEPTVARLEAELKIALTENERLKNEAQGLNAEIAELKTANAEFKSAISKEKAGKHIALAALSAGVMPEALDDVMARAEREGWSTDDHDNPVLWDAKNDSPVYSSNGFGNLTPEEWAKGLKTTARHYFSNAGEYQPQSGGGGGRSQAIAGIDVSGPNPWVAATWDDMAQVQIIQADRGRAEALAKAAGSRIGALKPA